MTRTDYEITANKRQSAYAVLQGTLYSFPNRFTRDAFLRDNLFDDAKPLTRIQVFVLRLMERVGL